MGDPLMPNNKVDKWHTNISDDAAKLFGHYNSDSRNFIDMALNKLPEIPMEKAIVVGCTGYWDLVGDISSPRYGRTVDSEGRLMFFIDNHVIMQRYTSADTLIFYNRDSEDWHHSLAYKEDEEGWISKLKNL